MTITQKKISDLIFAEYNPRQLSTDQYEHLKSSLSRFGFVDPVIVNMYKTRKNIIIGGHQRVKVWKDMGNTDVPCVEVKLDHDKERELNVRLNKNTGDWDYDILEKLFDVGELMEWGFSEEELKEIEEDIDLSSVPQAMQLEPTKEYAIIVCDTDEEWEEIKEILELGMVRRGGYKIGSDFDVVSIERVVAANKIIEMARR